LLLVNRLCGFGVGGGAGTLAFVTSANSTAQNVTCPTVEAGDLLVLLDRGQGSGGTPPAAVVPTNFSIIDNRAAGIARQVLSYKIAVGNEEGTSLTGMNGSTSNRKILAVFRQTPAATAATPQNATGEATSGNPAAQVVGASAGAVPLVVIGAYGSDLTVDPRTMSPAKDAEILNQPGGSNIVLAYKIYNAAPADVSVDMDDESNLNILQSCYITCS